MTLPLGTNISFKSGKWVLREVFDTGGSSKIFLATSEENKIGVIKVHRPIMKGYPIPIRIRNEMKFKIKDHPHIIAPKENQIVQFNETRVVCLLLEFFNYGELSDFITKETPGKEGLKKRLMVVKSMASTVEHLHENGWIHGDISDRNFLLDCENHEVRLIDFETSIKNSAEKEGFVWARREFLAPEVDEEGITALKKQSDIWSLGLLIIQWVAPSIWQELKKKEGWREIYNSRKSEGGNKSDGSIILQDSPEGIEHIWEWLKKSLSIDWKERPEVSDLLRCLEND